MEERKPLLSPEKLEQIRRDATKAAEVHAKLKADQDHFWLRFEAAKAAMQGMLTWGSMFQEQEEMIARFAVRHADALLAELAKPKPEGGAA